MKRFSSYLKEDFLQESLDTPVEFYMTDDTKMPNEIYGAFRINDNDYGISLVKSKYDKVYILELYRVVSVKKRTWSFKSPKDIRPALSTLIKFVEATYPFIQAKVDGIIIDVPGKTGSERFVSFMSKMLKKSYIKKFREVPIQKTTDKAKNYLFMVKTGVEPTSIFKTATFWKNFKFDHESDDGLIDVADLDMDGDISPNTFWSTVSNKGEMPTEVMDTASKPYKKTKAKVSLTPSKKYVLGKAKVELIAGQDLIDQLDNATAMQPQEEEVTTFDNFLKKKGIDKIKFTGSGLNTTVDNSTFYLITNIMSKAVGAIKQYGYDPSKFNWGDFKYAFEVGFKSLPLDVQSNLVTEGIADSNGSLLKDQEFAKDFLEQVGFVMSTNPKSFTDRHNRAYQYIGKVRSAETSYNALANKAKDADSTKTLNWGNEAIVEDSRMDYLNNAQVTNRFGISDFSNADKAYEDAKAYLFESSKSVKEFYDDPWSKTKNDRYDALRNYTGSDYEYMNKSMRSIKGYAEGSGIVPDTIWDKQTKDAIDFFLNDAPRLEKPMWVLRNMNVPHDLLESLEPGENFFDAAFLSTTIKPTVTYGYSNGRMKIYLPAGTPVFPAFEKHSKNPSEAEIVLAPGSVIRIVKRYDYSGKNERIFEGIYLGNAAESMYNKILSGKSFMEEQMKIKQQKSTKGEQKGFDSMSLEDMQFMLGLIKSKKIKLDTQTTKKEK